MKSILIIEDDKEIRETLQTLLEIEGYSVVAAENGLRGLEKLRQLSAPSLIFVDLFMPQMSGLEFLRAASEHHPVPKVIVSACPEDHAIFREAKTYATHALTKPLDLDQVLDLAKRYAEAP